MYICYIRYLCKRKEEEEILVGNGGRGVRLHGSLSLYMSGCIYRSMLMSVGTDGGEPKGETFREKKVKKKGRERGVRYKTTRVQHDLAIP